MSSFSVRSRADSPAICKAARAIEEAAWSRLGYLNYTRSHYQHFAALIERHPDLQLCLIDDTTGYVVAASCCAPFHWDGAPLPPEGWDWAVEQAMAGGEANAACMLTLSVPDLYRSRGLARQLLRAVRSRVEDAGLMVLVAPVRPAMKALHPGVSIDDYAKWRRADGLHYDSWMRSHESCGGALVGPCHRSMVIDEPLGFWENWLGRRIDRSGDHPIAGALGPLKVDLESGRGRYEEPNIWFQYPIEAAGRALLQKPSARRLTLVDREHVSTRCVCGASSIHSAVVAYAASWVSCPHCGTPYALSPAEVEWLAAALLNKADHSRLAPVVTDSTNGERSKRLSACQ